MAMGAYTYLSENDWDERIDTLDRLAARCELCPRRCGVNRPAGERGFCGAPAEPVVSSIFPHHGEEPPISGTGGSGTVFFTYCTLKCVFCQNYQISHEAEGRPYSVDELAHKLIGLENAGCHNINLVTPTHFLPWLMRALRRAAGQGLTVPLVYNCGGYELERTVDLLAGVVDIWLPDMKYGDNIPAQRYSSAPDYVAINQAAIRRMFRQVGPLACDAAGIAHRGLLIRHLVLPNDQSVSRAVLDFLTRTFDPRDISVSLMAQYRPLYCAERHEPIGRRVGLSEYEAIKREFIAAGFEGYYQEPEKLDTAFVIDFTRRKEEPLTGE